jgi:pimeloyl-ACP methyl ester carboxylesterase
MEHARKGTLAPIFQPTLERPDLARERYARGESAPLFRSYADPSVLTDDVIRLYLQPLLSSPQRIDAFQRYWLGFDNAQTVAIHGALKALQVPTLIVWGLKDIFFDRKWAYGSRTRFRARNASSKSRMRDCFSPRIARTNWPRRCSSSGMNGRRTDSIPACRAGRQR